MDWIQFGILIATILVPTIGGILHILNTLWTIKHLLKTLSGSHSRTKKTVIRHDREIAQIRGHLGIYHPAKKNGGSPPPMATE